MENEARQLDSPWWNSKISQESSEWLAENVKGLDRSVKEMLLLIEHNEDFSEEKPHGSHPIQPEFIARIKEISNRHHLLADYYNKLTGELSSYIQSANEMKNHEKTAFGSQVTHPFLTPDKKVGMQNGEGQVVCSEFSVSSGGGISDTTPIEGSESSSLSSDSDSESCNSSPCERSGLLPSEKMMKHEIRNVDTEISEMGRVIALTEQEHSYETIKAGESREYEMLMSRISEYENELKVSKEKFQIAEKEIARLNSELQNNEALIVNMGSMEAQLVSAENRIKLHEVEIGMENKRSLMLQRHIVDLEAKLESEKRQVQELQETIDKYTAKLSDRDLEIQKLNVELQDASGNFALEKWQLESSIIKLSERLTCHEARTNELQKQCESFEAEKVEMLRKQEALATSWQDDMELVKVELRDKNILVDTLNANLDELKLKRDTLMAEKDGVNAKLQTLSADLSVCNDQIQCLERNLLELHSENKRLSAGSDSANKLIADLKSRIDELEKEVGMQAVMITDTAEEKREAIRQLCFSLDHFRSAYEELRNEYATRKRPTAMVL